MSTYARSEPSSPAPAYKRCTSCRQWRPPSDFWRNATKPDGLQNECKTCKRGQTIPVANSLAVRRLLAALGAEHLTREEIRARARMREETFGLALAVAIDLRLVASRLDAHGRRLFYLTPQGRQAL